MLDGAPQQRRQLPIGNRPPNRVAVPQPLREDLSQLVGAVTIALQDTQVTADDLKALTSSIKHQRPCGNTHPKRIPAGAGPQSSRVMPAAFQTTTAASAGLATDTPSSSAILRTLAAAEMHAAYVTVPAPPRTLADTGGLVVTDDGRRVLVFDRCTGVLTVLTFVLGALALVVVGFGSVALVAGVESRALGTAFLAVGFIVAALTYAVVRKIRRRRSQPLHECRSVAVLDRKLGLFSYGGGAVVPLDQVRFLRKLQIGSSSPKLVAVTPGATLVLKRGNPFDGGVGNVDEVLSAVVRGG